MDLEQEILSFPKKNRAGFTFVEMDKLLEKFPETDRRFFDHALFGVTCMKVEDEAVFISWDVLKALRCAIEKRGLYDHEWD